MSTQDRTKIKPEHLNRNAFLYVRQSTIQQVVKNTESTRRQYELRRRAVALGWSGEQIITIDSDLGKSGTSAADREGFQRLVAEVGMERAGIVLGLEVSRLARNSSDWHRLLDLCALNRTLILDEDGLYDPREFNDRLLLGLKGTMSEAEIFIMRSRLLGGILHKARRGELRTQLPVGLCYDPQGQVVLDPDRQVRETIALLFTTFFRLGAAAATVRHFRDQKIRFPRRIRGGAHHGELIWGMLHLQRAAHILHNPRYAGCYVYGRRRHRKNPQGGTRVEMLPRDQWVSIIQDAHPGYISWEQFQQIERMLAQTAKAYGQDRRHGPPREGPALLQGRVLCGRCGSRMSVQYHRRPTGLVPDYFCINRGPTYTDSPCQIIAGGAIDEAVGKLVVESVQPEALQLAVAVQQELKQRITEADRLRKRHVERTQYEADLARLRYMKVDPQNRLVAGSLEADWNEKLRAVEQAQQEYEAGCQADHLLLNEEVRRRIANLADEFPKLWNDPGTSAKDRKRMLALLIEDVTLLRTDDIKVQVRFRGGATQTLQIPRLLNAWEKRATDPATLELIDDLLDKHHDQKVAELLNHRGMTTGAGEPFSSLAIQWVRHRYGFKSFQQRLAERGFISTVDLCRKLGVGRDKVRKLRREGALSGLVCNAMGQWMYEPPDPDKIPSIRASTPQTPRGTTRGNSSAARGAV